MILKHSCASREYVFYIKSKYFYTFRKYYNIKHLPVNDLYGMGNLIKYCYNRVFLLLIDNTRI